jgi:hypothetical protein
VPCVGAGSDHAKAGGLEAFGDGEGFLAVEPREDEAVGARGLDDLDRPVLDQQASRRLANLSVPPWIRGMMCSKVLI